MQFLMSAFLLLIGVQLAFAQEYPVYPTEREYATLPSYCKEKIEKKNIAENKMWSDSFGADTWLHMHHHCQGLNDINRYYRESKEQQKKYLLSTAINQFDYMVSHLSPGDVFLAEVYQNRGRAYLLQGQEANGIKDLYKALELSPKIARTYLILADQLERGPSKDKALQIVSEGLRHVPASKGLQRRYQELGGKPPFPEPHEKPVEQSAATEAKATATAEPAAADKASEVETTKPAETKPAIGMPGNPYCRYCPDQVERKPDPPQAKP